MRLYCGTRSECVLKYSMTPALVFRLRLLHQPSSANANAPSLSRSGERCLWLSHSHLHSHAHAHVHASTSIRIILLHRIRSTAA
jgi:hypothetical protein